MATPVVTVASGGLPVVDVTATSPKLGLPVTEALAGRGMPVTKVAARGMPVTYSTVADYPAGGGGAFTPASLTGLIGWWDASVTASLTLSGSNITGVADQSGSSNHLSSIVGNCPAYGATSFNSKPGMTFIATGFQWLKNVTFAYPATNTLTVFMVLSMTNTQVNDSIFGRFISYTALGTGHDYNDPLNFCIAREFDDTPAVFRRNSVVTTFALGYSPRRLIATLKSDGTQTIYVDGAVVSTTTVAVANFGTPGQIFLGYSRSDSSGSNARFDGIIAEAGVATGWHDATAAGLLDTYLKNKWAL